MDTLNICALLIADWFCAVCLSGVCELNSRGETPKPPASGQPAYTITVSMEKAATIPEEGLTVELVDVKDNRCAVEVKCVWAGEAEVALRLGTAGAAPASVVIGALNASSNHASAPAYGAYRLRLVSLEPGNSIAKPVPQSLYRATISVSPQ